MEVSTSSSSDLSQIDWHQPNFVIGTRHIVRYGYCKQAKASKMKTLLRHDFFSYKIDTALITYRKVFITQASFPKTKSHFVRIFYYTTFSLLTVQKRVYQYLVLDHEAPNSWAKIHTSGQLRTCCSYFAFLDI